MIKKLTFSGYALEWLLEPESPSRDKVGVQRLNYPMLPESGNAWVESLQLNGGITVFRAVHEMDAAPPGQMIRLMDVSLEPSQAIFSAQIWLSGLCCHREYWQGFAGPEVDIVAGPGRDTFRYHNDWYAKILIAGGTTSEMRSVVIPHDQFAELLGEEGASELLKSLQLDLKRLTSVRELPAQVSAPLRSAMSGHVSGAVRKLYAQAQVLEYMALLQTHVNPLGKAQVSANGMRTVIIDLHDRLLHLEGRLPTLSDLAATYAVPARRLNDAFVSEYGKSIYAFVSEQRLQQAHELIRTTPIALKVVAARLGYSHVNHFIVAFKRQFGYPPGSLKKGR